MSTPRSAASQNAPVADKDFASDVEYYLALEPRQLPSRYLYDALGSALFNAICELPWYRITRGELDLLRTHGREIFAHSAPVSRIVELGPGNGSKLLTLIEAGRGRRRLDHKALDLHLIDVSARALDEATHALALLDDVEIVKHQATYESGLIEIARTRARTLVLFLGSNIGNFDRPGANEFLRSIRAALEPGDDLLIGADLVKPESELLLAYDDPLGVTAAFNRNLLVRVNRELEADFELDQFAHRAVWNEPASRMEMHLIAGSRQHVEVRRCDLAFDLEAGEPIWTESLAVGSGGFVEKIKPMVLSRRETEVDL